MGDTPGVMTPEGFVQRVTPSVMAAAAAVALFMFLVLAAMVLFGLNSAYGSLEREDLPGLVTSAAPVVVGLAVGGWLLCWSPLPHGFLMWLHQVEVVVSPWPASLDRPVSVVYRGRARVWPRVRSVAGVLQPPGRGEALSLIAKRPLEQAGPSVVARWTLEIPASAPPALAELGPWKLALHLKFDGAPDLMLFFPVAVKPGARQTPAEG